MNGGREGRVGLRQADPAPSIGDRAVRLQRDQPESTVGPVCGPGAYQGEGHSVAGRMVVCPRVQALGESLVVDHFEHVGMASDHERNAFGSA